MAVLFEAPSKIVQKRGEGIGKTAVCTYVVYTQLAKITFPNTSLITQCVCVCVCVAYYKEGQDRRASRFSPQLTTKRKWDGYDGIFSSHTITHTRTDGQGVLLQSFQYNRPCRVLSV